MTESMERLDVDYIDVILVHDVEYADDLQHVSVRAKILYHIMSPLTLLSLAEFPCGLLFKSGQNSRTLQNIFVAKECLLCCRSLKTHSRHWPS